MKPNIFIRVFRFIIDILFEEPKWEYGTAEVFPQYGMRKTPEDVILCLGAAF